MDDTYLIYLATEIVSDFGDTLEKTSDFIWGLSEKRLPYSKSEIQCAIEVLLKFFQNERSWSRFKRAYPELSVMMFTNRYYGALRFSVITLTFSRTI